MGPNIFEFLLQLEEAVLDFLFDVFRQLLLGANQLRVLRVTALLHDPTAGRVERLLELVDTAIRHRQLFILLDLAGCLRCYTKYCGSS